MTKRKVMEEGCDGRLLVGISLILEKESETSHNLPAAGDECADESTSSHESVYYYRDSDDISFDSNCVVLMRLICSGID